MMMMMMAIMLVARRNIQKKPMAVLLIIILAVVSILIAAIDLCIVRISTAVSSSVRRLCGVFLKCDQRHADLPNLTEGLLKLGFSSHDVVKFLGGNFMRVFETVWKRDGANQP